MGGIVRSIGSAIFGGVTSILGGIFGGPQMPKPPKVEPPPEMPDPEAMEEARRRSLAEQLARRGRESTILTTNDTLGG